MDYEVDFLPVGDGKKSGDAIALRFGNLNGPRNEQTVVIIDGGTQESGAALVSHVKNIYNTNIVDLVVNTHPDADHASGLSVVLEELNVRELWMHRPWEHSSDIKHMFDDGTLSNDRLSSGMKKALSAAWELEKLAKRKNIPIVEPFSDGTANGRIPNVYVLGPSLEYYQSLLPGFRDMPDVRPTNEGILAAGLQALAKGATAVVECVARKLEDWGLETLTDPAEDATSPENNSSAILFLRVGDYDLLFTGDAGVPALELAADRAESYGVNLPNCRFQQVPHHGSKRNVGPTILDRIVGPKFPRAGAATKTVIVSAAKEGEPKHPAKKVVNAYIRRGATVLATQGKGIVHYSGYSYRPGWGPATPLPFSPEVDEDE